jgi:hypothetical protein
MTFQVLIGIVAALWLSSLIACALAWRWSFVGNANRFVASIILCVAALIMGYLGLTRFHLTASQTVNGETQWSFNSRYFFIATVVLAALTLAYTIWKNRKPAVAS